jgi:glucosylglycerate phosphorylase
MIDTTSIDSRLLSLLTSLYGEVRGPETCALLRTLMDRHRPQTAIQSSQAEPDLTEREAILITYGDQVQADGQRPLGTLADFCARHLPSLLTGIHLLPFFTYSTDDGFSVIDYRQVAPALGDWEDIARLRERFHLMFDAVINHVSGQSEWFRAFLRGELSYQNYFITLEGQPDLSHVVRPRALPLLTTIATATGEKRVWTTFSPDQIDLNFSNPRVLLEIIDLLLFYVARGADFIRLDAIAYLWKEIGTPCIHQPQTHQVVQLFRAVLDELAPQVRLITETNVPHTENVAYFGDGQNEAHLVYNFALPPLVLHSFRTGQANDLTQWVNGLTLPSERIAFFNFLASHDGIGLNPVRGVLPEGAIDALVQLTLAHGGFVSYKHNPDGSQSPYELNINYFDALSAPDGQEPVDQPVNRFMAAQAIMLALAGLPGIYFHSLFGSRGWPEGVAQTGHNRAINRQKFNQADLERELADETNLRHKVFTRYSRLLAARASSPAFQPHSYQRALDYSDALFALLRMAPQNGARVLCLHNLSDQPQSIHINLEDILSPIRPGNWARDLITGQRFKLRRQAPLRLRPYQVYWLTGVPYASAT